MSDTAGSCPAFDRYAAAEEAVKRAREELLKTSPRSGTFRSERGHGD